MFDYENVNPRPPSRFLALLRRVLPGVDAVESSIAPYAAEWQQRNIAALAATGPLWVALGDSLSQGVGASSVSRGWVARAQSALLARGIDYRVVNLSFSGARVADVVDVELPAMAALAAEPALVTVFIGSNDVIRREGRRELPARFERMLGLLPSGSLIATVGRTRGLLGELDTAVLRATADHGLVAVPIPNSSGNRAADHFHPNDTGHAVIARAFVDAITTRHG